jgi:hypothetical protein
VRPSFPSIRQFLVGFIALGSFASAGMQAKASALDRALPGAPVPNDVGASPGAWEKSTSLDSLAIGSAAVADHSTADSVSHAKLAHSRLAGQCERGELRGKTCRVRWGPILGESFEFLSLQHIGNIATDKYIREYLVNNPFWSSYIQSVEKYRFNQWSDDTPFIVHNIGHPLMGAITSSIFEQNDPKGRSLVFVNNGNYWRSRTKAMAFSAAYSAQWKIGPLSEASIGNSGLYTYHIIGLRRTTNETGFQDFIITPVYGMGWNVMEDLTDRFLWPHIHHHVKNRLILTALFWITPAKSGANILRFKPTYYRDTDR